MNLEQQKELLIKEFENIYNLKDFIEMKIKDAEYRTIDPYSEYGFEDYLKIEFNCNVSEEHEKCKNFIRREIRIIERKIREKEKLERTLKELQNVSIIKTGRQVAIDNIKKQLVLIHLFDQDEVLIDNYENMFGINLNIMTAEEIDQIDLTVFTDCQPW